MAFAEVQFPPRISLGATGGPVWQTNVVRVNSGAEYRNRTQSIPLARWDVSHAGKIPAEWQSLRDFHYVMGGRATAFRYKDWSDYIVTLEDGVFIPIDSTHFQLGKRYAFGALSFIRPIYKPIWNRIAIPGGTVSSVDETTGIVTMTSGTPTAWRGEFDIPARFDIDNLPSTLVDKLGADRGFIFTVDQIPIQETRDIS